jgi:hypothetical protein
MQLSYQLLILLPFLVLGALTGLRRGWRAEAITTFGLLLILIFFGTPQRIRQLAVVFNQIVLAFGSFFSALLDTDLQTRALVDPANPSVFRIISFVVLVILAYIAGSAFAGPRTASSLGALVGGIVGVVNAFLVGSQVFSLLNQYYPTMFGERSTIIITPGDGAADALRGYLPTIFAVLFLFLLIYLLLRSPRTR